MKKSFILSTIIIFFIFFYANLVSAVNIEIPIVGKSSVSGMAEYFTIIYNYLIYLSGVFAVIIIMISGSQWVLAGGDQSKITNAKERIKNAILGLILMSSAYLILNIVNSRLVNIEDLDIVPIDSEEVVNSKLKPPETMEELVGRDADECWSKGGGYMYQVNETTCVCDSSGIKDTFPMSYDDNSWCCICNNCPSGSLSRVNNCFDDCVAKGCEYGNPWSATLPTCCKCSGCLELPVKPYNLGNGCQKFIEPYLNSCIATQADKDDQSGYTPNVGEPGWCTEKGYCAKCLLKGEVAENSRQCTNYPKDWDKGGVNVRQMPCGEQKTDKTVTRSGKGKCKDKDY